jgi:hypothetical protein
MARRRISLASQAWIELIAGDPEAGSALAVARSRLAAAAGLAGLRRLRVVEISGALPDRATQEDLLHRSTQFYNPHKERCMVRLESEDPVPVGAEDRVVLVSEQGGERRPAAERWWRHETGKVVEVREAVAWVLRFEPGIPAAERAAELATLRDRGHGLLCNPYSQQVQHSGAAVPLPWLGEAGGWEP